MVSHYYTTGPHAESSIAILPFCHVADGPYAFAMQFGDRLKKAREVKKLTQDGLGELVGASKQTISHWEKGRYEPSLEQLSKLCGFLGATADELVLGAAAQWPFRRVKLKRVTALKDPGDVAYVEGRLEAAIEQCEQHKTPPVTAGATDAQERVFQAEDERANRKRTMVPPRKRG